MSKNTPNYDVVTVGSCMIDLICYSTRLPSAGETIHGSKFVIGEGGKGANQCVAASKLGASSALVARLGNDGFGLDYFKKLSDYSVCTEHVKLIPNESSGMAQITVADSGENQIVIVAGANDKLSVNDVQSAKELIKNCGVLLCQMEIPIESTLEALKIKFESKHGLSILNLAPAPPETEINPLLYTLPNIFCVNETEASLCTGVSVTNIYDAYQAARILLDKGCVNVIITLGEDGCVVASNDNVITHVATPKVTPVDTTGAGDAFIGALAYYLIRHTKLSILESVGKSCVAASFSVQKPGTQVSFPSASDIL